MSTIAQLDAGDTEGAIRDVAVSELRLPLRRSVRNGTTTIEARDYTFLTVELESGVQGVACGYTRATPLRWVLESTLAPRCIGRSVFEGERLWREAYDDGVRFMGTTGVFMRALSLLDIAIWDARGKLLGTSVASLLGGANSASPALIAAGYYRNEAGIDDLVAEYADFVEQGYRHFKIMAGGLTADEDAERFNAVRAALPASATLAVDVNGAWQTASDAAAFLDRLVTPPAFVEDPFLPGRDDALRSLRRLSDVRLAVGEWQSEARSIRHLLDAGLVDVVRLDVTTIGGVTEWLRAAALASTYDAAILPHFFPGLHAHLAPAASNVLAIELVPPATWADNFDDLVTDPWWMRDTSISAPTRPGFGLDWRRKENLTAPPT